MKASMKRAGNISVIGICVIFFGAYLSESMVCYIGLGITSIGLIVFGTKLYDRIKEKVKEKAAKEGGLN